MYLAEKNAATVRKVQLPRGYNKTHKQGMWSTQFFVTQYFLSGFETNIYILIKLKQEIKKS